ncbi:hypothetical protein [Nocardia sp. NPDC052566]|uniref:DUF7373 family lipoprotein n=1 Tax=Nocardia sp. NPDC052566 TaxID=3364330 RepID=UPI0037C75FF5
MITRPRAFTALLAAALTVLTGCVLQGNPIPAKPELSKLDFGAYHVDPLVAPTNNSEEYGRILESVRMGEAIINPRAADPALTFQLGGARAVPLPTADKVGFLAVSVRAALEKHGMLAGFASGGADQDIVRTLAVGKARLLTIMLLRFPDAEAARNAAADIDAIDAAVSQDNVPVTIAEHPGARAHWRPAVPTLAATLAHDSFVISLLVGHPAPELPALSGLAQQAFGAQVAALRDFTPTPPGKLAVLPLDRDGMLARMVPKAPGQWPYPRVWVNGDDKNAGWRNVIVAIGVVYGPRAAQLLGAGTELKDDPKGILMARSNDDFLLRHPDVGVGRRQFTDTADEQTLPGQRAAAVPAGVPDIRCTESLSASKGELRFGCHLLYGRYEAILYGTDLKETQQRSSAQLALLVKSE